MGFSPANSEALLSLLRDYVSKSVCIGNTVQYIGKVNRYSFKGSQFCSHHPLSLRGQLPRAKLTPLGASPSPRADPPVIRKSPNCKKDQRNSSAPMNLKTVNVWS